jgi:thiol-disulfide isomerase/thioredoxin
MRYPWLVLPILLIVATLGFGIFLLFKGSSQTPPTPQQIDQVTQNQASPETLISSPMTAGEYVEYSPEILARSADQKRVLFFYASWCPTCRPADADFKANQSQIPAGVSVIRVNYNDPDTDQAEKDLAQKYGVTYQHTYVQIDQNGNQVTKWNGGKTAELLANIK